MPPIPFPVADGRRWPPAQEPRRRRPNFQAPWHKIDKRTATFRRDRDSQTKEMVIYGHERAAPATAARAAQAPRQGRGRNQGAQDSLPRNHPEPRPREATGTRSKPAAAASSAKSTSACSPCRRAPNAEEFATKERFPSMQNFHYDRGEQFPLGRLDRRRHDSQQLPARRGKGVQGAARPGRDRRVPGAERLRGGLFRQAPSGRQLGAGVQDGRLDGLSATSSSRPSRACWNRSSSSKSPSPATSWATSTATCRAAADACWAWTPPAATCKPSPPRFRWPK